MNFTIDDTEYRIARIDFRNLAIQRRRGDRWLTVSYHGNSAESLAKGLNFLIVAHYSPDASDNLVQQLGRLEKHITACSEAILAALSTRARVNSR